MEHVAMNKRKGKNEKFSLDLLLHPARAFTHPADVLADSDLTISEKRAILASWASDACAVEGAPELRKPTEGAFVRFDEIMDALQQLDGEAAKTVDYKKLVHRARRVKDIFSGQSFLQSFGGSHIVARSRLIDARWKNPRIVCVDVVPRLNTNQMYQGSRETRTPSNRP
jgi:hypothetical protein